MDIKLAGRIWSILCYFVCFGGTNMVLFGCLEWDVFSEWDVCLK